MKWDAKKKNLSQKELEDNIILLKNLHLHTPTNMMTAIKVLEKEIDHWLEQEQKMIGIKGVTKIPDIFMHVHPRGATKTESKVLRTIPLNLQYKIFQKVFRMWRAK